MRTKVEFSVSAVAFGRQLWKQKPESRRRSELHEVGRVKHLYAHLCAYVSSRTKAIFRSAQLAEEATMG
jgi:hypothetical protein